MTNQLLSVKKAAEVMGTYPNMVYDLLIVGALELVWAGSKKVTARSVERYMDSGGLSKEEIRELKKKVRQREKEAVS